MSIRPRPVLLCILDGWGYLPEGESSAIRLAKTPNWTRMLKDLPFGLIEASALDVGLPTGQMGNSEVGHMNLGAGRVVMQDLVRVDAAIEDGSLARNPELLELIATLKKTGGTAHLLGLLSPGGVHAHQHHMAGLARAIAAAGVPVAIHAFTDGRDTPPRSALDYLAQFDAEIAGVSDISIASVTGRYFAMDRDNRWDRVSQAYDVMVDAKGERSATATAAVEASYAIDKGDEFVKATAIGDYAGMRDGDGIVMANFRADRAREILTCLLDPAFERFTRHRVVRFAAALGVVEYSTDLARLMKAIFPPEDLTETFGEVISKAGLTQLRIAETEKYAHVTFFFNGGKEEPFPGEERILIPSPNVATYDLQPEMSAPELTNQLVAAIGAGRFDVIIVNFANSDMVGHTGIMPAAIKAVETIDTCLGRLADAIETAGGTMLITADHGNIEELVDPESHQPHTAHTTNPVPLVLVNGPPQTKLLPHGRLSDIAPTLLTLLNLPQPAAMKGKSLLVTDGTAAVG